MTDRPARRHRAKQLMDGVTVACVALALAIGTGQLVREGLQEFLYRPPGVGASPSEAETAPGVAEAQLPPQTAQLVPNAPVPSATPVQRDRHHAAHNR
ncbi:MAG: hypothetical protein E6I04_11560 [Chloroflexi bacterium]|nr:MAG: hypothetical protein E6I04_11560 [Chloroflexota bacterium]